MCRLFQIRHSKCGHLHHCEPVNPCKDGFSFMANKCLAKPRNHSEIGNTIPLFDYPYCEDCVRLAKCKSSVQEMIDEIRRYYARQETIIIEGAKKNSLSYRNMNRKVLDLRARRKEEVEALQANVRSDGPNDGFTKDLVAMSALGKRIAALHLEA